MNDHKFNTIFWDFDGVLMRSNDIRDSGFEKTLLEFPKDQVEALLDFHRKNGGLSRYVKFRYFFENIRGEEINEEQVNAWAQKFSEIMLMHLVNPDLLIEETWKYVKSQYKTIYMHIVSGSDEKELKFICKSLGLSKYFLSINGSPTPKKELVSQLLLKYNYYPKDCVLIGDSINDYEAAIHNKISFEAYNNENLVHLNTIIQS